MLPMDQNTIAAINHQRPIRIKFHDHSRLFYQLLMKNWPLSKGFILAVGARFIGCCRCIEV